MENGLVAPQYEKYMIELEYSRIQHIEHRIQHSSFTPTGSEATQQNRRHICVHTKTCTWVFIATFFVTS